MRILIISIIFLFSVSACRDNQKAADTTEPAETSTITLLTLLQNPAIALGPAEKRMHSDSIQCTGEIDIPPTELLSIHSKVGGTISFMHLLPGDPVKKGALLFRISDPELIARQREFLEILEKYKLVQKEFERKNTLFLSGAIHEKEFQEAEGAKNLLLTSYNGMKKELSYIGIDTEKLEKERSFDSSVPVYSQLSGVVQEVYVNMGQMIRPETRLMNIASDEHIHLELNVLAKDVPMLEVGQEVFFTLPEKTIELKARVERMDPILDKAQGTRRIHCHIDDKYSAYVLPGMFVNAIIKTGSREVSGLLPEAVIKIDQSYYVFQKNGDQLVRNQILPEEIYPDFIIFQSNPTDTFVTRGAYYIE
jgi:cobalt-zinc-cadmium efflux system membrane fusion protein